MPNRIIKNSENTIIRSPIGGQHQKASHERIPECHEDANHDRVDSHHTLLTFVHVLLVGAALTVVRCYLVRQIQIHCKCGDRASTVGDC